MMSTYEETLAKGIALVETGDLNGAEKAFRSCIEMEPEKAEGLFFLPYLTGERHPYSDGVVVYAP